MKMDWKAEASWLLVVAIATSTGAARAGDEPEPIDANVDATSDASLDMEFLEYLGSWETSDDEWILFAGEDLPADARTDPSAEREEPGERNDEE